MIADRAIAVLLAVVGGGGAVAVQQGQGTAEQQADRLEAMAEAATNDSDRPKPRSATKPDMVLACRLAPTFHTDAFKRADRADAATYDRLVDQTRVLRWRSLPAIAHCGKATITFQPKGFGAFVTDIARSADGRLVGLRGGWQGAPLAGAGADCLYEIIATEPKLVGCVRTWVS